MEEQANPNLLIAMPSDDELYDAFMIGLRDGVHEGIKSTVQQLSGYIEKAKEVIKDIVLVDPANGLVFNLTMETGNKVLADFEEKQSRLMRNALKLILAAFSAGSFTSFVEKMKKDPQSLANTIGTLSKVMTIFFAELGKKYLTKEIETSIHEKVATLFA